MPRYIAAIEQSRSLSQRRLGTHPDRRRSSAAHRRRPRRSEIETLEDRVVPATITVANLGDTGAGTLRAAIEQANLDAGLDTITFAPSVTGTITLATALPDLSANVVIAGPGISDLSVARSGQPGTPAFRIFTVAAGVEATVSRLTISGGLEDSGGGISNSGTLTVTDCTLSGNSSPKAAASTTMPAR